MEWIMLIQILQPIITRGLMTAYLVGKGIYKPEDIDPTTGIPKVPTPREELLKAGFTEEQIKLLELE